MRYFSRFCLFALLAGVCVPASSQSNQRDLWIRFIREPLLRTDGSRYFEDTLRDSLVPGGVNGIREFRGTVLSSQPEESPYEFIVAITDEKTPELKLRLRGKLDRPVPKGAIVFFNGVPVWFTLNPFQLTMEVIEPEHFKLAAASGQ